VECFFSCQILLLSNDSASAFFVCLSQVKEKVDSASQALERGKEKGREATEAVSEKVLLDLFFFPCESFC
jgi:hypothetical protein